MWMPDTLVTVLSSQLPVQLPARSARPAHWPWTFSYANEDQVEWNFPGCRVTNTFELSGSECTVTMRQLGISSMATLEAHFTLRAPANYHDDDIT